MAKYGRSAGLVAVFLLRWGANIYKRALNCPAGILKYGWKRWSLPHWPQKLSTGVCCQNCTRELILPCFKSVPQPLEEFWSRSLPSERSAFSQHKLCSRDVGGWRDSSRGESEFSRLSVAGLLPPLKHRRQQGEQESFTEPTDSIMADFSVPERRSIPAFRVPSASESGGKSVFMSLLNAAEVNLCERLLKIQHYLTGPL